MGEIAYPKLKHILSEKWADINTLQMDLVEDFMIPAPGKRIVVRAQGRLGYRKAHNAYSFHRETRTVTEITEQSGKTQITCDALTVFDGQHVYDQQDANGKKFVHILSPYHRSIRMTIPCLLFFKFIEKRGIIEECSEQVINDIPYYLIGLEVLQAEQKNAAPALEVFYIHRDNGVVTCERFFDPQKREIGRRVYSNLLVNHENTDKHYVYTKPQDVIALPMDE